MSGGNRPSSRVTFEKQKRSSLVRTCAYNKYMHIPAVPNRYMQLSAVPQPPQYTCISQRPPNRYIHLLAVPNRYNAALIGPSTATLYLSSFSQHHCCCRFQLKFQKVSNTISQLRRCPSTASQHDVSVLVLCSAMPTGSDLQSQGFQDGKMHWT